MGSRLLGAVLVPGRRWAGPPVLAVAGADEAVDDDAKAWSRPSKTRSRRRLPPPAAAALPLLLLLVVARMAVCVCVCVCVGVV